jgi:hypothetical protein
MSTRQLNRACQLRTAVLMTVLVTHGPEPPCRNV